MTHPEMDGAYELYVLGALEPEVASEIDQHLGDQCGYCLEQLHDAVLVTSAMAGMAEERTPPPHLRDRILASVTSETRSRPGSAKGADARRQTAERRRWIYAFAACAAAAVVLLAVTVWSTGEIRELRAELASAQQEREELRSVVQILSRPETRTAQFGREENAAHGRVFLSRSGGVVFVGSNLPPLAPDRTFELWYVPATGNPQPAGLFRPNEQGQSVRVWPAPGGGVQVAAVAVTIEPAKGSSLPTTTPILVVPVG